MRAPKRRYWNLLSVTIAFAVEHCRANLANLAKNEVEVVDADVDVVHLDYFSSVLTIIVLVHASKLGKIGHELLIFRSTRKKSLLLDRTTHCPTRKQILVVSSFPLASKRLANLGRGLVHNGEA